VVLFTGQGRPQHRVSPAISQQIRQRGAFAYPMNNSHMHENLFRNIKPSFRTTNSISLDAASATVGTKPNNDAALTPLRIGFQRTKSLWAETKGSNCLRVYCAFSSTENDTVLRTPCRPGTSKHSTSTPPTRVSQTRKYCRTKDTDRSEGYSSRC
jgi:hypothetical protein